IDTRRQGDRIWVRVADFIPPNIHQFPPNADPMAKRTVINRPAATTWAVPIDDTHTMQIGFYRAPEGQEPRRGAGFGQDASRPYEGRRLAPGVSDAQATTRGGISRQGRDPLAAADGGVRMMRNMPGGAPGAVRGGPAPPHLGARNGEAISTF